jgi:uncharacterized membrane protein YdjX (TVP38/TMEM64 family)
MKKTNMLTRLLPLILLLAIMALAFSLGLDRHLSLDSLRDNRQALIDFADKNIVLAALAYVALYIAIVAFSLPGSAVMTLAGGFLFGTFGGGALTVVAATLGATALFMIAKGAIGNSLRERAGPFLRRMEDGFHANAFSYLLFLRLVPAFPFWVVNLVPALLGVPSGVFIMATLLGIIPGTFIFASFGAGLGEIFDAGAEVNLSSLFNPPLIAGLVGLGLLSLLPIAIRKWKARAR